MGPLGFYIRVYKGGGGVIVGAGISSLGSAYMVLLSPIITALIRRL